ncbi:MAG TPA: SMI1/KNR4 family protein [Gemmataceae bacterium]|nr:SMI1/KNR4 family protein [Gemmataceae bacterium]
MAKQTPLEHVLSRLEAWLRRHRSRYLKELHPGATAKDLTVLDAALGTPAPDELRTLLAWHNGQDFEDAGCFQEDWMLLSTTDIVQARRDLTDGWAKNLIPFLDDDAGSYLGLDTASAGHPICSYVEDEPARRRVVAPSLTAWLQEFVSAVEKGQYHEDPERGSFLKTGS